MEQPKAASMTKLTLNDRLCPTIQKILMQLQQVYMNNPQRSKIASSLKSSLESKPTTPATSPTLTSSTSTASFVSIKDTIPKRPRTTNPSSNSSGSTNQNNSTNSSLNSNPTAPKIRKTRVQKSAFKYDNRPYIRRSFTPMSELLQPVTIPTISVSSPLISENLSAEISEVDLKEFDQILAHQKMELFESRIQLGLDEEHPHPALAIKALDENPHYIVSKDENNKFGHYVEIEVKQMKPKFWEDRCWDSEGNTMNDEQTDKLRKQMIDSYIIPEIEVAYTPRSQKTPKKKKKPRRTISAAAAKAKNEKNSLVFDLYAINVLTDCSDFDTDFEDF
ncbi:hypothetical protein TRFO_17857 [Tritrichomonas foetus]|uniref:Uncharacterized protein n=1 Tax=Tritrichomonas foetus TaxID=1144522 RepID=A0A1J4KMB7_9EUKA|nr:hypothetical protein TRFO_17857 [Tritrichomonas foetus]|eukprot:OHT12371.1 hypothetical protein TRFO_17857 [Tritrichomonas foetus]